MLRSPVVLIEAVQLTTAYVVEYTAPNNTTTTLSAFTLNNTTATPQTVTIAILAGAGAPAAINEIVTTLSVPAAGAAPTIVSALIGHHLAAGETIQMKCSLAASVTVRASGYATTP